MLSEDPLVKEYNIEAERSAENSRYAVVRAEMEKRYRGRCDITALSQRKSDSGITELTEETVIEDMPCLLSFEGLRVAESTETAAKTYQRAKLFISPDIRVASGSKVTVRQDGMEREYVMSGIPAVYPTHREIMLKSDEGKGSEGE